MPQSLGHGLVMADPVSGRRIDVAKSAAVDDVAWTALAPGSPDTLQTISRTNVLLDQALSTVTLAQNVDKQEQMPFSSAGTDANMRPMYTNSFLPGKVVPAARYLGPLPGSALDHTLCGRGADSDLTVKNKYGRERCFCEIHASALWGVRSLSCAARFFCRSVQFCAYGAVLFSCVQRCTISIEWPRLHVMLGAHMMFTKTCHACASSRGGKKTNF